MPRPSIPRRNDERQRLASSHLAAWRKNRLILLLLVSRTTMSHAHCHTLLTKTQRCRCPQSAAPWFQVRLRNAVSMPRQGLARRGALPCPQRLGVTERSPSRPATLHESYALPSRHHEAPPLVRHTTSRFSVPVQRLQQGSHSARSVGVLCGYAQRSVAGQQALLPICGEPA